MTFQLTNLHEKIWWKKIRFYFRMWFFFLYVGIPHSYWNRISTSFSILYETSIFLAYADIFLSIVKRLYERETFFFIECVLDGTRSHICNGMRIRWCMHVTLHNCMRAPVWPCECVFEYELSVDVFDTVVQLVCQYYTLSLHDTSTHTRENMTSARMYL